MIAAVVDMVLGFLGGIAAALPSLPAITLTVPTGFVPAYNWLNAIFPVSEGLTFGGVLVTIYLAGAALRLASWIWHLIPKPFAGT